MQNLPHTFLIYSYIWSYFLVGIHSTDIQIQMDLNQFLRSCIDFNAFLVVLCTHYFPAIGWSPDP